MYAVKSSENMLPVLVLLLVSLVPPAISAFNGLRVDLTHVDAGRSFTNFELLQRMALRSRARGAMLVPKAAGGSTNSISTTDVPVLPNVGEYILGVSIGSPAQPLLLILDTGSDLVWTQCQPCLSCFNQRFPLYDPSQSSTYSPLACSSKLCQALPLSACHAQCLYLYSYGDQSTTVGTLASEAFTFRSANNVTVPNLGFGCGFLNGGIFNNESGIAGFGRGPLSLISQLGVGKFSYCFISYDDDSKSSALMLGSAAGLNGNATTVRSTPFVLNPSQPTFYYLSLDGITVGTTRLPIPKSAFALQQNGTAGVIIDSGTSITQLTTVAYKHVRSAFLSQVKLPVANGTAEGFDLCFSLPSSPSAKVDVPKLIFHFEGADMDLPRDNYMFQDSSVGLMCLAMLDSGSESSIIGNFQQQNMHVVYDLDNQKLSFAPARCDHL
ncbi:aspartic proteinase nepenthesin-1-like [Ananas comosus]|uniref:Aspartic proteinase nepenthesin-1 n=1 Tax=Ananas comosus TaxID=4615 RepID=A0A199V4Y3_ANACO|nr:aspartic proteinase nepenthesin-1-like [Ananas comosus]OAY71920.1 Aspartic proteinase nepenthesin-1 [Ananas comosus]